MKKLKDARGFTIVELLISTVVFSAVLVLCATAIVQVGRMFYKGVTINRTQDATRQLADDVAQAIQFGVRSGSFFQTASSGANRAYCLGEVRYTYRTDLSLGTAGGHQSRHILWKDKLGVTEPCTAAINLDSVAPTGDGQEMLGTNMRLPQFDITPSGKNYLVTIRVAYGETTDLFIDNTFTSCIARDLGGQFCALSRITTNVVKRL